MRSQRGSVHIAKLVSSGGVEVTESADILEVLTVYYQDLYASKFSVSREGLTDYLNDVPLPSLSESSRQLLELPIICSQLEEALQLLPKDKAPGSDGFPAEFFKLHKDTLLPPLLEVFQEALETGHLPPSMREAIIVLIPKPGKDPTDPGSYRPISLLPVNIKLLAKVLATRLSTVIHEVIHEDQAGFMPNRSTAINIR